MIPYGKWHSVAVSWSSPLTAYSTFIFTFKLDWVESSWVTISRYRPEGQVGSQTMYPCSISRTLHSCDITRVLRSNLLRTTIVGGQRDSISACNSSASAPRNCSQLQNYSFNQSINQSFICSWHIKQWSSFSLNINRDEQDSQAPGALMAALIHFRPVNKSLSTKNYFAYSHATERFSY